MIRRCSMLLAVATFACLVPETCRSADPMPAPIVITPDNADQLQISFEVPKRVHRITRGPGPDELTLFDWNGSSEIANAATLATLRPLIAKHRLTDLAVSSDGKYLAWTERDSRVYTVQEATGGKLLELEIGDSPGNAAFSPNGKLLAIGYTFRNPLDDDSGHSFMQLFDLSGKLVHAFAKSEIGSLRPVFSPDGKILAVGNRNDSVQLFEVATGALLHTLVKRFTQELAFSPDGKTLAVGYVDGTVALWDVATGKQLHSQPSGCREVYSVDWAPHGKLLVTSGDVGKIVLWEPSTLKKIKELPAPRWVINVRFSADSTRLLTSSASDAYAKQDRKLTVWAIPPKK